MTEIINPAPQFLKDVNGVPFVITSDGRINPFDDRFMKERIRPRGFVEIGTVESFIAYANAHKIEGSEIALSASGAVRAILYIDAASTFKDYGAKLEPACTQSFKDWLNCDRKKMDQADFAEFLEGHIQDIVAKRGDGTAIEGMPTGSEVLTFCSDLQDTRQVTFRKTVCLQNGMRSISYSEKDGSDEGKLELFSAFSVSLAPYIETPDAAYIVKAALRYRINGGDLAFWYELASLEAVREKIRAEYRDRIAQETGLPVYLANI